MRSDKINLHRRLDTPRESDGGFTLVEILIVVAIIATLSAIAIPQFAQYAEKGRIAKANADLRNLKAAINTLGIDTQFWPLGYAAEVASADTSGSNEAWDITAGNVGIFANDGTFDASAWGGPYLPTGALDAATGNFLDPWGSNYFVDYDYNTSSGTHAVVGSFGPNKVGPNAYDNDDIYLILSQ